MGKSDRIHFLSGPLSNCWVLNYVKNQLLASIALHRTNATAGMESCWPRCIHDCPIHDTSKYLYSNLRVSCPVCAVSSEFAPTLCPLRCSTMESGWTQCESILRAINRFRGQAPAADKWVINPATIRWRRSTFWISHLWNKRRFSIWQIFCRQLSAPWALQWWDGIASECL